MLGLLCLQITCVWCKERVEVPERPQGEKLNYLHVLKDISHNKAWLLYTSPFHLYPRRAQRRTH